MTNPLRLHRNEGRATEPASFLDLPATGPELARRYPEGNALRDLIAGELGVCPECVLVTAGADDAIDRICRIWLGADREILVHTPTFQMIPLFARMTGATVVAVPDMWTGFPEAAMREAVTPSTGVAAVVTPNNPSGAVASADELSALADALPSDAVLLVDGAYMEFADMDPTRSLLGLANVVVTRTFSKAWGLAGLRVGYAIASPEVIARMKAVGTPYPVSTLALELVARELRTGQRRTEAYVERVRDERAALVDLLQGLGQDALPSQANFVFVRTDRASWLQRALGALGIRVRILESWPDGIRITCPGDPEDFARLERALGAVCAPEAILFDMDGVLVDVSGSYRAAIKATVESMGGFVDDAEIDRWKAAGNSNDDWILSRDILRDQGVDLDLKDIIDRFESFYQGTGDAPGLRTAETPLVTVEWVRSLASQFRLGIVTGRPRVDAARFLEENGLAPFFEIVVAREDGPLKPDPAPVRTALAAMRAASAWMVGDTPDDVAAARGAGVLPVAVLPPGAGDSLKQGLLACEPAILLSSTLSLDRYLP